MADTPILPAPRARVIDIPAGATWPECAGDTRPPMLFGSIVVDNRSRTSGCDLAVLYSSSKTPTADVHDYDLLVRAGERRSRTVAYPGEPLAREIRIANLGAVAATAWVRFSAAPVEESDASDNAVLGDVEAVVGNPAAGADFSWTAPTACRIVAVRGVLTTSASVANRTSRLIVKDAGGAQVAHGAQNTAQAAALAWTHEWAPIGANVTGTPSLLAMPDIALNAGWQIQSLTALIDAGDAWSGVVILYRPIIVP